ncbi:MAG: alpha-ketoglutarate-dependent dioxygenase AlkB [Actinomycetota bacterium]|nr:alpha-ketoglutarate-dependent dioxygenase AlkB [Actinomycetota bacterium]
MARPPSEEPEGLIYRPELLTVDEEADLLRVLEELRFDPIVIHGQAARRTARHFGLDYDYEARTPQPGEAVPDWILPVRAQAADLAGHEPEELVEVLVQRYPPGSTIGWHRDAPAFGNVVGVSLGSPCVMRFQRGSGPARRVYEQPLEPRSAYVLSGPSRSAWQHSIPATAALRYSVTFRTVRNPEKWT